MTSQSQMHMLGTASPTGHLLTTLCVALVSILIVSWHQLGDPFVRHDDYPALLGLHDEFYIKTLEEGRWVNYWWMKRPWLWSSQVNFYAYLLGWATFSAAFAANALGPSASLIWRGALAVLVVLTPQAVNISQWYNTLIPGVWILAIYGVFCLYLPWRWSLALLLVFAPLSFSAYTTYPFVLLALLMTKHDLERSWRNLALIIVVFAVSFALSMGMAYGLNWIYHDVFGIVVGDWRQPNPATNLQELVGNLPILARFVKLLLYNYGLGNMFVGFAIYSVVAVAFFLVFLRDRGMALFALVPTALGLGLLSIHALTSGVSFPVRSSIFVWMSASYAVVQLGIIIGPMRGGAVVASAMIAGMIGFLGYQVFQKQGGWFNEWQASTRALADRMPDGIDRVVVYGERFAIDGAREAGIQTARGVSGRLTYLTGLPVIACYEAAGICDDYQPPFSLNEDFGEIRIEKSGQTAFVRLPPLEATGP